VCDVQAGVAAGDFNLEFCGAGNGGCRQ
jgi:hypothetical protein